jgi:uncharacterized protein (TIGR03790 family)
MRAKAGRKSEISRQNRWHLPSVLRCVQSPLHDAAVALLVLLCCAKGFALEPAEVLVMANGDNAASVRIARYYCEKRHVPAENILAVSLGVELKDTISRSDYEEFLAGPIRKKLLSLEFAGKIRCLLTTYGMPYKVAGRGPLKGLEGRLKELKELADQQKTAIEQLEQNGLANSPEHERASRALAQIQLDIDRISGKETGASVDSELSMVLFGPYDLYRWQLNMLRSSTSGLGFMTLMVSRLDGPDYTIVKALVDKAIAAEEKGLKGIAYIDSRGLPNKSGYLPGYFDQSLRDLAVLTRLRTGLPVQEEQTEALFAPGTCPRAAIYCGWYSLKKYIDAFDFVDGAVGYHIASFEAVDLRDPNSTQWCPAMLRDGITATLGAVAEPYLHGFPEPRAFFVELYNGSCLVEAYYRTAPFNSWQLVLIGDPLYTPFKRDSSPQPKR